MQFEDKIIKELIEIKQEMKNFVTKDEFHFEMNRITNLLDLQTAILHRLDQERLSHVDRMDRIERIRH